jgi:electron transport complex protein RnfC
MQLLPQQLYWFSRSHQDDRLLDHHLSDCIECGACDVVCPSWIPLTQTFKQGKIRLRAKSKQLAMGLEAQLRFEKRNARIEAQKEVRLREQERKRTLVTERATPNIQEAIERAKRKRFEKHADLPQKSNPSSEEPAE